MSVCEDTYAYGASEAIALYFLQTEMSPGWRAEAEIVTNIIVCSTDEGAVGVLKLTDTATIARVFGTRREIFSPYVLDWLAHTEKKTVRRLVAGHENVWKKTLVWLSSDESPEVRAAVAKNMSTPMFVLARLSDDRYRPTLRAVLNNPNTQYRIREKIAHMDGFCTESLHVRLAHGILSYIQMWRALTNVRL